MKVHNSMGIGFQEVIYHRCLAIELEKACLFFKREIEPTTFYEGNEIGIRRAVFVGESQVIVELKELINWVEVGLAQTKNYGVAYGFPGDLLMNVGVAGLQFKKVDKSKSNPYSANFNIKEIMIPIFYGNYIEIVL